MKKLLGYLAASMFVAATAYSEVRIGASLAYTMFTSEGTETTKSSAEKNNGSYFNNQRIKVSNQNDLNSCLFVTSGAIQNDLSLPFRKSGCAALDMAYVASGRYDGFFQNNLNLWDIAAGIVLINEAGGIVNKIDLTINKNIKIIASSTAINEKLLEKLNNF